MGIIWANAQKKLANAGFNPGGADGVPGRMTFTALFAYMARRQPDATLRAIGQAAATLPVFAAIAVTPFRLSEFLAQACHESGGFSRFEENLHYSAKRLCAVWPSRFPTLASAAPYAWDPTDPDREDIALANLVYGSRMGNEVNGTDDDDGWTNRGRGMLQHTGAAEYAALYDRLLLRPDDIADPARALEAAVDYWTRRNVNSFCDRQDWKGSRKAVNGGWIGLEEVATLRQRALKVLS